MTRLLAILIDGFRYDYLSPQHTPYLHSLQRAQPCPPLRPILGYSDAIRATIFTGTYPHKHNYWMNYKFSPQTSPFGIYRRFGLVDRLPSLFKPWAKMALSKVMERFLKKRCTLRNMPVHLAPFFDYTTDLELTSPSAFGEIPTLFDLLRQKGRHFHCIDSSKLGWRYFWSARPLSKTLKQRLQGIDSEASLVYVYFHYLDHAAHRYGTESPRFLRELREVDSLVQQTVETMGQAPGDTEVMIFSDHGMINAPAFINFQWMLKDKRLGKDYMVTLDSTMARFWYFKESSRDYVHSLMERFQYGHFLSYKEKQDLKINFLHDLFGEDIYLIKPPYNIFPNFISLLKPVAMHAYHPELESQQGILLLKGSALKDARLENDHITMVELMPTMAKVLGLEIPTTCQGESLL